MAKKEFNKDKIKKEEKDLDRKLVSVRRVTKVVKGGRNMSFSAFVVVGDHKGKVGIGTGKAAETSVAVEKAFQTAKKNMVDVTIINDTVPHEEKGQFGASTVLIIPAPEGTGIIAGGSSRAIFELAGYKNIVSKSFGARNKINTVKATLDALSKMRSKEVVATMRGKTVDEI